MGTEERSDDTSTSTARITTCELTACCIARRAKKHEQESYKRPTYCDELAQHSEVVWFVCGGKYGKLCRGASCSYLGRPHRLAESGFNPPSKTPRLTQ
mgnify:CR=1 FL=1